MNEYGGIELTQVQEAIYKVPDNEIGALKDAFCVDRIITLSLSSSLKLVLELSSLQRNFLLLIVRFMHTLSNQKIIPKA